MQRDWKTSRGRLAGTGRAVLPDEAPYGLAYHHRGAQELKKAVELAAAFLTAFHGARGDASRAHTDLHDGTDARPRL